MAQSNQTNNAVVPESKKSMADMVVGSPTDPPAEATISNMVVGSAEPTQFEKNKARYRRADQFEREAEHATKENLIGGFDFNYEYMNGDTYMSKDLKERQAQLQPGVDKFKRGLARFAGEFAINVLETPGILFGAGAALAKGDINEMTNNFWVKSAEAMKEHLHEANPVYSSRAVREGGVWDKMSSGEWIATEGASALAFMASALVPGLAVSKGFKALKMAQGLAKGGRTQGIMRMLDKGAAKIGKVTGGATDESLKTLGQASGDLGTHLTTTMTNTVFESGIEAMGAQQSFQHQLDMKYENGEIDSKTYNEMLPYADKAAGKVFRNNMLLLTVPNLRMTSLMLGPTAHTLQKAHKNISRQKGKWIKGLGEDAVKKTRLGRAIQSAPATAVGKMGKGFGKNLASEGLLEEMGQMAAEQYHTTEYLEALISGEDKRNWAETYARVAGSTDGQVAALTGGLISGPMSMRQRYLEGKQLRKQTDELVNNYNGVDNYYQAVRNDIHEVDENGDIVYQMVNEKGEPVEEGGEMKPKVDQVKLANIADARDETNKLVEIHQQFMDAGEVDKAAAISARLQAAAYGVYLHTGPEGLQALEDMMTDSPSTKLALDEINRENGTSISLQEFVGTEMDKARDMAKDYQYYERNISAPLTRKWEKANNVQEGTPEGAVAMAHRARFETNYRNAYSEASAVLRELESRVDEALATHAAMEKDDRGAEAIEEAAARVGKLLFMRDDAKKARNKLESTKELNKRWDAFFKSGLKAQEINSGELAYNLDEVISQIKEAKSDTEIIEAVESAVEKGLIIPGVKKDKLPAEIDTMARSQDVADVIGALTILNLHDDVTLEEKNRVAAHMQKRIDASTSRVEDLEAFKAIGVAKQEALDAQAEKADYQDNQESVDTTGGEFEDGTADTAPGKSDASNDDGPKGETYRGIPVEETEDITNAEGQKGSAQYSKEGIKVNRKKLKKAYDNKAWTNPRDLIRTVHGTKEVSTMTPLPAYLFQSYEQFEQFVLEHEYQHSVILKKDFFEEFPDATKGQYEDAINRAALEALDIPVPNTLKSPREILSAIEVNRPAKPESNDNTYLWLTEGVTIEEYYDKLTELVVRFRDQRHTVADVDQLYLAVKQNTQLAPALESIAPHYGTEIQKRGVLIANESWAEYVKGKEVTEREITDGRVEGIDAGYEVPDGVRGELAKIIKAQRDKVTATALKIRIEQFNANLDAKKRLWGDLRLKNSLVKPGSTVYWKGLKGKHFSGAVRSIIKGTDDNGTNVLIEDTKGELHVVNAAGLHSQSIDIAGSNEAQKAKHAAKADKQKKEIEKGKVAYSRIGAKADGHPTVVKKGTVEAAHPTIKNKFIDVYNAFLRYLEEPRNKSKDKITFAFQESFLDAKLADATLPVEEKETLSKVQTAWKKAKAGTPLAEGELDLLIDHMPIALRAHRTTQGSAGSHLRTKLGEEDQEFTRVERPLRAKIIGEWLIQGGRLSGESSAKHTLDGVSANWGFQYTGDINVDEKAPNEGNFVHKLRDVTIRNMKLFTVGSIVSNEIINKNGDRTKVPADLRDKVGGIFINVKDNNGKTFPLRLNTNTLAGTPELKVIMKLVDAILVGDAKMNMPIPAEIEQFMEENMPELSKVFKETPSVGVLYNTLVYKGGDTSQLGVSIDPLMRTITIGQDRWNAENFYENRDVIEGMIGLKLRNINFPSTDQTKNKLPSTDNIDYLTYIMETKAVSTNVKQDAPLFVGKPDPNNPNYMGGINPYLSPNEIKGDKPAPKKKQSTAKKAGTIAKKATALGSRTITKLRKAGYTPTNLSQKAIDFITSVASKKGNAFIQALEDYNNRVISENEENAQDHVIKKCKG